MASNNFNETVESLFKGMDSFLTTKTVVGEAIKVDSRTTILPLVEVGFGVGAGAYAKDGEKEENNAGGGMGGKISPSAILVITDGKPQLVNVKNQDSINKIIDMVPDLMEKLGKGKGKNKDADIEDVVDFDFNDDDDII